MPMNIVNSLIDMYADDTLIYVCYNDIAVIEKCLNEDLASLTKWLNMNLMKANVSKLRQWLWELPLEVAR